MRASRSRKRSARACGKRRSARAIGPRRSARTTFRRGASPIIGSTSRCTTCSASSTVTSAGSSKRCRKRRTRRTSVRVEAAPPSSLGALLAELSTALTEGGIALAADEARDIVAAILDVPRFWPTTHRESLVDSTAADDARRAAAARLRGAPFAYAVGRAAFRYLTLAVDERVLIPRQETELLVDLVLQARGGGQGTVADIGTGSGAIALALATEGTFDAVVATDVSLGALAVAEQNASFLRDDLRAPVEFLCGS